MSMALNTLTGQGIHAGRPRRRRLGGKALAARALLHGAARAAGGKGRSDRRGCRAGGAEGGVRRAGAAVRPAPARERRRKRPCSPRLHRARGLQGNGGPRGAPHTPTPARGVRAPGLEHRPEAEVTRMKKSSLLPRGGHESWKWPGYLTAFLDYCTLG